ncbi:MAG: hypothetical protein U1A77_20485 [Pirellulales bacterium]
MSAEDRSTLVRRVLTPLVLALPALIVAFSVVMAGFLFAETLGDAIATRALRIAGVILLLLMAVVGTLLVSALGFLSLSEREQAANESRPEDRSVDEPGPTAANRAELTDQNRPPLSHS